MTAQKQTKAVILLSGGLDSATVMAMAKTQGFALYALSFAYGQRQTVELEAAAALAKSFGAQEHRISTIDLGAFGGSALTDTIDVPKGESAQQTGIPVTYVPARNTLFLSYALAWCEVLGARDIFLGVNAVDYSGYPDCRPAFISAFAAMANLATKAADDGSTYRIHAPLMHLSKADIITAGSRLGVDYAMTHSCYDPQGVLACGQCAACQLRKEGFIAAHTPDPTRYVTP
jgi:7-cyano-7-deazaguanine synthase